MKTPMTRRSALGTLTAAGALIGAASLRNTARAIEPLSLKGNINHSVCKWCYKAPLEEVAKAAHDIGMQSVELLTTPDFPTLKKYGLICAMVSGVPGGIQDGWNRIENHDKIVAFFEQNIPIVADAGYPNIICFSGNRRGQDDEEGLKNCAAGLKRVMKLAEDKKVTVCMELLNSKVDHKDYQCDHTAWGVELCKRVGSERFKLLYDIYHMQIMEGDVIRTIKQQAQYLGHYHTGGNPGRHEIDETQELNYPAIMKAIKETGFKGHVAQEFIPAKPDQLASLRQGVQICDV